jgi:Holliday junction resolvase RusA-like endonuclease
VTTPLTLLLPEPPSANRWWRHVGPRVVTSQAAREYKQLVWVRLMAARVVTIPVDVPVRISVAWFRARKSGDLDKRLGVLLDALQGTAYVNDSQIVRIDAWRIDGDERRGHVEVTITPTEPT